MLSYVSDIQCQQGNEVRGNNERCPLTSNFGEKNSALAGRAFDCHILILVKQLLN